MAMQHDYSNVKV